MTYTVFISYWLDGETPRNAFVHATIEAAKRHCNMAYNFNNNDEPLELAWTEVAPGVHRHEFPHDKGPTFIVKATMTRQQRIKIAAYLWFARVLHRLGLV
jgi:hypothetical protein